MSWKARAKNVAASLKAEYDAGKQGDDSPAAPIWATPQQQLSGLLAAIKQVAPQGPADGAAVAEADPLDVDAGVGATRPAGAESDESDKSDESEESDSDAAEVADAIRGVDWAGVRAATSERTAEATRAMKSMADHVDWAKVQPVAAQVSSALIAAISTGQLGVGGRLASTVARTITNQNGLGQKVAAELDRRPSEQPIDFRSTIDAASHEV